MRVKQGECGAAPELKGGANGRYRAPQTEDYVQVLSANSRLWFFIRIRECDKQAHRRENGLLLPSTAYSRHASENRTPCTPARRASEEELRASLDPKYAHLSDDLHVEITAFAPPAEAHARIAYALAELRKYLIPDSNDEIRQEQMREMEMIQTVIEPGPNGTPRAVRRVVRGGVGGGIVVGGGASLRGRGVALRGGGASAASPGLSLRGGLAMRGGGAGAGLGAGRGLLSPPPPGAMLPPRGVPPQAAVRKPMAPPPSLLPRPVPTKTKVLSILDRARVAMEESYSCEEELAGGGGGGESGFYESYDSYNTTGYTNYDDYEEGGGPTDYYSPGDTYPGKLKPSLHLHPRRKTNGSGL
ncbi:hypothetical protein PR048_030782 [Dryococelus australis]|uniref:KH domain-containing, RNA-binding, signal transduction-associated protein 2 n=1 Tax=Dryococelus australis TaxID=614101 RepID=A0ABQ9G9W1_9NEOP|nr:hypothetical protein PR048_030782 [Dryococelus australis]